MSILTEGSSPLTGVGGLANVTVAFPGEVWSDAVASGRALVPGEAVVVTSSAGKKAVRPAVPGDAADDIGIVLNEILHPDYGLTPLTGPNEAVNASIAVGKKPRVYYSGSFHLTLITAAEYVPGDKIGWDVDGARQTGKTGTGAWAKDASADIDSIFVVDEFRPVGGATDIGILTVRRRGTGNV